MNVLLAPIEMTAWFDLPGAPRPISFRHDGNSVKVEQIIRMSEERQAGKATKIYECRSEIDGIPKRFNLNFDLNTCKWYLRMEDCDIDVVIG